MTKLTPFIQSILLSEADISSIENKFETLVKNGAYTVSTSTTEESLGKLTIYHEAYDDNEAAIKEFGYNLVFSNPELLITLDHFSLDEILDNAISSIMEDTVEEGTEYDYEIIENGIVSKLMTEDYEQTYVTFFAKITIDEENTHSIAIVIHDQLSFFFEESKVKVGNKGKITEKVNFALFAVLSYVGGKDLTNTISIEAFNTFGVSFELEDEGPLEEYFKAIDIRDQIFFSVKNTESLIYQKVVKVFPELTIADIVLNPDREFPLLETVSMTQKELETMFPDLELEEDDVEAIFGFVEENPDDNMLITTVYIAEMDAEADEDIDFEDVNDAALVSIGYKQIPDGLIEVNEDTPIWYSRLLIPFIQQELQAEEDASEDVELMLNKFLSYVDTQVEK